MEHGLRSVACCKGGTSSYRFLFTLKLVTGDYYLLSQNNLADLAIHCRLPVFALVVLFELLRMKDRGCTILQ